MDRLNNTISDVAYILDSLCLLRNILETGSCNDCKRRKDYCDIVPKPGRRSDTIALIIGVRNHETNTRRTRDM